MSIPNWHFLESSQESNRVSCNLLSLQKKIRSFVSSSLTSCSFGSRRCWAKKDCKGHLWVKDLIEEDLSGLDLLTVLIFCQNCSHLYRTKLLIALRLKTSICLVISPEKRLHEQVSYTKDQAYSLLSSKILLSLLFYIILLWLSPLFK